MPRILFCFALLALPATDSSSGGVATASARAVDPAVMLDVLGASDRRILAALAAFRAAERTGDPGSIKTAAAEVLRLARVEREVLEDVGPPDSMARPLEEELVFFNHLILGFADYVAAPKTRGVSEKLRSIIRRGLAHRERAWQQLATPGGAR